jgi:hypothetical protein
MKLAWRHEFRLFIIEHASFIFLNQEGLWILQTVSVEFLPPAMRGRMLSAHHDLFNLNCGISKLFHSASI